MQAVILENEATLRLAAFLGVFLLMATLELLLPRRPATVSKARRWGANLSLTALNTLSLRLAVPVLAAEVAAIAADRGWGLFNLVHWPTWLEIVLAVVILDAIIYAQHVAFHLVPALWRLHRVHHTDLDYDVTTAARFHPVEILLSMAIKLAAVVTLGPAAVAVILFEVLLNGAATFNHANVRLPLPLDRVLRLFIVTPDMHRVHHSIHVAETNSNYGFNLPWWDRLFGTYRPQPAAGHEGMVIGVREWRQQDQLGLVALLALPFRKA